VAEAEEVLADAALHATNFARGLWHRHRKGATAEPEMSLREMAQRLDILLSSVFGKSYPIRIAQPPAPATFLTKVLRRDEGPRAMSAIPATDGTHLWLPACSMASDAANALAQYRVLALQQATRAHRGSAQHGRELSDALEIGAYLVLEAQAADGDLIRHASRDSQGGIRDAVCRLARTTTH
jgi:nitric oxide reductase NorD protein